MCTPKGACCLSLDVTDSTASYSATGAQDQASSLSSNDSHHLYICFIRATDGKTSECWITESDHPGGILLGFPLCVCEQSVCFLCVLVGNKCMLNTFLNGGAVLKEPGPSNGPLSSSQSPLSKQEGAEMLPLLLSIASVVTGLK